MKKESEFFPWRFPVPANDIQVGAGPMVPKAVHSLEGVRALVWTCSESFVVQLASLVYVTLFFEWLESSNGSRLAPLTLPSFAAPLSGSKYVPPHLRNSQSSGGSQGPRPQGGGGGGGSGGRGGYRGSTQRGQGDDSRGSYGGGPPRDDSGPPRTNSRWSNTDSGGGGGGGGGGYRGGG